MRAGLTVVLLLGVMLAWTHSASAQAPRLDAIWARSTAGQHITLDGVLDEPAWALAESVLVRYGKDNGIPGSGYKEEGGKLARDSTYAIIKFLVDGNQLYMAATVKDSSVGGAIDFNRFDGFLMAIKDHLSPIAGAPPVEYLYSWWFPEDTLHALDPGRLPCMRGFYGNNTTTCGTRTPAQIAAWDAATRVRGLSNSDAVIDTGYVTEMRFDLGAVGYDVTTPQGDIVEWNVSIYDCDWFWPINLARFSANRAWLQSPWGNAAWYDEMHIYAKPSVTINSGPTPFIQPDVRIPDAGVFPPPTIDGHLNETVWSRVPPVRIRFGDENVRQATPGIGRWRYGWTQPDVFGHKAVVQDTADATVKMFVKNDTLYMGFDVSDQVVQYYSLVDRWDGFIVTVNDRVKRYTDRNLYSWRLTFQVDSTGKLLAQDELPYMRDTLFAVRAALSLKPGTTVDTMGAFPDVGYQAEMALDLTKFGYPPGLGDRTLWIGVDQMDGDSFTPFTDSYGTRSWWYRQYQGECCPPWGYIDPTYFVTTGVEDAALPKAFALAGAGPNPFSDYTRIRYTLPVASHATLEVFDVQGRKVETDDLGLQPPGQGEALLHRDGLHTGVYLYRLRFTDPVTRTARATLSGKVMFLR